ncbi:MAG: type II toxin-antitoxin system RelE/ParE family toxin [Acidimicrobiales bacterium]|nr:type II toxin-antitoxin system RelE/ParE family toxin [Acidimicrobiales bacterium]
MWSVELETEVEQWMSGLSVTDFAAVLPHVERLAERGNLLRMPASRSLGDGLFELRFDLLRVAWRITYFFATDRRIVLLTVFRKQRQSERAEVRRARWAMARCITEGHTAEEDD